MMGWPIKVDGKPPRYAAVIQESAGSLAEYQTVAQTGYFTMHVLNQVYEKSIVLYSGVISLFITLWWQGNTSCISGPLCGESTDYW